ncbi:hypothetical protein BC830DRAFT_1078231 [Chytriomyces sp. MP71]|nr:hypothetical protein BC830DRAFT_1078231 [Chytriomyces sp. MP71]
MPYFCHACSVRTSLPPSLVSVSESREQTHFTALPAGATENAPYCPDCQSEFVEVVAGSDNDAATNYADFAFDESEDDGVIDDAFGGGVGGRAMPPPQGLGLLDLVGLLARTGAENRPELGTVGAASTAGGSASGRAIGGTTGVGITSPQVRAQTFGFSISSANGGRPVFYGSMVDEDHPIVTMPPPPPFGMTTSLRDRILAEREQRRGPTVVDLDDAGELPGSIVNRGDDASESTSASAAGLNSEERRARTQQHHQRRQEVNLILELSCL